VTPVALSRLRAICLALSEAEERETWETPTFRIRGKIFAMVSNMGERAGVWCKAPSGAQTMLVDAAPERFFRPPYVGHKGWIGIHLDGAIDWDEVADLIGRSYRMTAPKKLLSNPADTRAEPSRRRSQPSRQRSSRT
jgi:predicted DNA-binding protein (MmcQ/YjbR family)